MSNERSNDTNSLDAIYGFGINNVTVVGRLLGDAEIFPTRSGKPKLSFRIAIPRSPDLPRKKPASGDFFTVICYGERFVSLLDLLTAGRQVVVVGWAQSRDVDTPEGQRVVNEIGARAVIPVLDLTLLSALDDLVRSVLDGLPPQEREKLRHLIESGEMPAEIRNHFSSNGQLHPEVVQAILRVLDGDE